MKPIKIVFLDFTGTIDTPFVSHYKAPKVEKRYVPPMRKNNLRPIERARLIFKAKTLVKKYTKPKSKSLNFYSNVKDFFLAPVTRVNDDFSNPYGSGGAGASFRAHDYEDNYYKGYGANDYQDNGTWNGEDFYDYSDPIGFTTYKDEPSKDSIKYLKMLLDKTGAKIVYSSTRRYSGWKVCSEYVGLPTKYSLGGKFGVTPDIPYTFVADKGEDLTKMTRMIGEDDKFLGFKSRQKEIKAWFKEAKGLNVKNYVILDDDAITDSQMKLHWPSSIFKNGFQKAEYEQALKILSVG